MTNPKYDRQPIITKGGKIKANDTRFRYDSFMINLYYFSISIIRGFRLNVKWDRISFCLPVHQSIVPTSQTIYNTDLKFKN